MTQPDPNAGGAGTGTNDPTTNPTTPPVDPAAGNAGGTTGTPPATGAPATMTLEQMQAEITRLRAENAKDRTAAKTTAAAEAQNALAQQIGKVLGLVKDEVTDPAKLTAQIGELSNAQVALRAENAILRGAARHGGDASALTDSREFMAKVVALDSASATYAADLDALIKTTVESSPRYKAGAGPALPIPPATDTAGGNIPPAGEPDSVEGMRKLLRPKKP